MIQENLFVLFFLLVLYSTCRGYTLKELDIDPADQDNNYYISTEKVSYYDALQMCHEKDMQLVSIETKSKNKEILEALKGTDETYWTSGNQISYSNWVWLKGEPLEYYNWKTNKFYYNRYYQKCIEVSQSNNDLFWNDQSCTAERAFICEKVKEEVTNPKCGIEREAVRHKNFYIGREIITYSKAIQMCKSMCMRLVNIEDEEKNKEVFKAFLAANATEIFWSSGHFKPNNSWQWGNGVIAEFFSWNKQEPNNARMNEYCIEILKNDEKIVWNDQPCEDKRMYVCEPYLNAYTGSKANIE